MLIGANGYLKLCDFGFAKQRDNSCTLCGTPAYMAPEIIQGFNQSFGVDWWALGIFIYEMIFGIVPFSDGAHMKMYEKILTMPVDFPNIATKIENTNKSSSNGSNSRKNSYNNNGYKQIIVALLRKRQDQRLGSGPFGVTDVKRHTWFQNINWDAMERQTLTAPYKPEIKHNKDISKFEYCDPTLNERNDKLLDDPNGPMYKWCQDF